MDNKLTTEQFDQLMILLYKQNNKEESKDQGIPNPNNKVCLPKKSLYGLKQASRKWHSKLANELKGLGYEQSKNDYSLFLKKDHHDITIVVVYVDDILLTRSIPYEISKPKTYLNNAFTIKDLGFLHYFLGIEISHTESGMILTQQKYTKELLKESGIQNFKKAISPLPINLKLRADEGDLLPDPTPYRKLIEKLNFLSHTRPDLAFTIQH